MNDTHPTVAVAELMRLLLDEEGLGWDEAWEITTKTCAYTNHTIMVAEALENGQSILFLQAASSCIPIIQEIDRRFVAKIREMYPGNEESSKDADFKEIGSGKDGSSCNRSRILSMGCKDFRRKS